MKFAKAAILIEFAREYTVPVILDGAISLEVIKGDMDFGGCRIQRVLDE
jgi:hypothetical protein